MRPRLVASLEPVSRLATIFPGLDDLDLAYACAQAGAAGLIVPLPTDGQAREGVNRFDRSGLPLLCVHAPLHQSDELSRLGSAPDRFLISDSGLPCRDFTPIAELVERLSGTHQEVAVMLDPDPLALKQLVRTRAHWVVFSTESLAQTDSRSAAEAELARLSSATLLAAKNGLQVALYGPMDRHLADSLAKLEGVAELCPHPTLWQLALRHGWLNALDGFSRWLS